MCVKPQKSFHSIFAAIFHTQNTRFGKQKNNFDVSLTTKSEDKIDVFVAFFSFSSQRFSDRCRCNNMSAKFLRKNKNLIDELLKKTKIENITIKQLIVPQQ